MEQVRKNLWDKDRDETSATATAFIATNPSQNEQEFVKNLKKC